MMQHVVAVWIADTLTELYADAGDPVVEPIAIIAQDPAYTNQDIVLLASRFHMFPDPEAFLAIDNSSLVMSAWPSIPVKAIVADLGVSPAALFWSQPLDHETDSGVDKVKVQLKDGREYYYSNELTRSVVEMLRGYKKMNTEKLGEGEKGNSLMWLKRMELWVRKDDRTM
jgi:hypothetical protein